jgi:hypothetical protein
VKTLYIQQPFGIGDCIFTQTIAQDYIQSGYNVIWPVEPHFVEGLKAAYPKVDWRSKKQVKINYENRVHYIDEHGNEYLPMRYAESLLGLPYKYHMKSKYDFLGKDWRRWKEHATPQRDEEKEAHLMETLQINKDESYTLVNTTFGSGFQREIKIPKQARQINMRAIDGFSLFDWCSVIENASEIYAVSTSTLYLFEILTLKAKQIHLYRRLPYENHFDFVKFLFTKNYILH